MDLLRIATELFMKSTKSTKLDAGTVMSGLKNLLADQSGNIDLAGLVSQFSSSGLGAMAASWLGDGNNESLSVQQIIDVFGNDKLTGFASSLGMDKDSAANGLASMIPQLLDKSSSGGSLLSGDSLGNALGGLGGLFK
jgi:uncharacterized protein YidB (DUF937 family)